MIGTGTLSHDLNRWWTVNIRGKDDPYLKIGSVNGLSSIASAKDGTATLNLTAHSSQLNIAPQITQIHTEEKIIDKYSICNTQ